MLTRQEEMLVEKIYQAIDKEIETRQENLARDITSTTEILRIDQGRILGLDLVRNEILPEVVLELKKQRN